MLWCMATNRVLGYVRVSTDEQAKTGHGLAAQRAAIAAECERRGWDLVGIVGEVKGASAKSLDRAGLQSVLARMDAHEADVLLVAKMDRLSRSLLQGAQVMERAKARRWALVALDLQVDTTTPAGEMLANVVLSTAQYERRLIGERTKAGLAAARAKGTTKDGRPLVLGRPRSLSDAIVGRIVAERADGRSLPAIAAGLVADGVPTAQGGASWHPSTIAAVLKSQVGRSLAT
jgi:DNA invertase Pin-like site-specific DNA recombinase